MRYLLAPVVAVAVSACGTTAPMTPPSVQVTSNVQGGAALPPDLLRQLKDSGYRSVDPAGFYSWDVRDSGSGAWVFCPAGLSDLECGA